MTREDAITLIDYHYWARDRMLDAVEALTPEQYTKDLASSFKSVRETVVHTYGAEWNWYLRWVSNSPTGFPDAAAFPDVADDSRRVEIAGTESPPARRFPCLGRPAGSRAALSHVRRPGNGVGVLADAAARREPRDVSPRPGDDDAEAARRARSEAAGPDQILSGTRDQSSLTTYASRCSRDPVRRRTSATAIRTLAVS